jgi:hypothetical protein
MIFISHRGNINGKNIELENSLDYINSALEKYYVEIDIWFHAAKLYLGHDEPQYEIPESFLNNDKLFVHCKNADALHFMSSTNLKSQYFWHHSDDFTITSEKIIWAHPKTKPVVNSVAVLPEYFNKDIDLSNCYGICSDIIEKYYDKYF